MTALTLAHRFIALIGMVVMAPMAYLMATGRLSPLDAATRAAWLFAAVLILRRIATATLPGPVAVVMTDEEAEDED